MTAYLQTKLRCAVAIACIGTCAAAHAGGQVPDISGIWVIPQHGFVSNEALDGQAPFVVGSLDNRKMGKPPLKPEYLAQWQSRIAAAAEAARNHTPGAQSNSSSTNCIPTGMPNMMVASFPMEILQSPKQITIINELYSEIRRIYLDEAQIDPDSEEPWYSGHSVGYWKGGTLHVDTVGLKKGLPSVPHSPQMRIDEEISFIDGGRMLQDRLTITDPVYLTQPWTYSWQYERMPDYKIDEYVCDNNRVYIDPKTGEETHSNFSK